MLVSLCARFMAPSAVLTVNFSIFSCNLRDFRGMPSVLDLLQGKHEEELGYKHLMVEKEPGSKFAYSGGGFLLLQHIIETMNGCDVQTATQAFLVSFSVSY